jgi:3',5'-cyclic AMP phosphodiesterase CpdA
MSPVVRLAHLSDVHITTARLGWRFRDCFSKRVAGWINRTFIRSRSFHMAEDVLGILVAELRQARRPDHVVFSGDATALGFPVEVERAATLLGVRDPTLPPGLAVPGNHDYYTPAVASSGWFEKCFAPWQQGERVDDAVYPFAQRVGPLWLVGVNSCTGNVWPGDAAGSVGAEQLERLGKLLARLNGPRILVTHYPVCRADGTLERPSHGLRDLLDVLKVAEQGGVALWLHGHEHEAYYHFRPQGTAFPVICVGSSTQAGNWGYHEYVIDGLHLQSTRRVFDPEARVFREDGRFELRLRG